MAWRYDDDIDSRVCDFHSNYELKGRNEDTVAAQDAEGGGGACAKSAYPLPYSSYPVLSCHVLSGRLRCLLALHDTP